MASKTKILFVNNMNNTGGLSTAVGSTTCHFELYCISNFSEENLLSAIDSVKVLIVTLLMFYGMIVIVGYSMEASSSQHVSSSHCLGLQVPPFEAI